MSNEDQAQSRGSQPGQSRKRATAVVNVDLCTGCGICRSVCPTGCISIVESDMNFNGISFVERQRCTGCNICAIDCPWFSITMINPDGTKKEPADYGRQLQKQRGYR